VQYVGYGSLADFVLLEIESPCAYAQGIIPATPGYTVLSQLSAKPQMASHVARTIPCGHRVHTPQGQIDPLKIAYLLTIICFPTFRILSVKQRIT